MNMTDLLKLVKLHCIFGSSLTRAAVIRNIQFSEGNFDCHAETAGVECGHPECEWREDCRIEAGRRTRTVASRVGFASCFPPPILPLPD